MDHINCFADDRLKTWCIHCGGELATLDTNRDHVPTKKFLREPYPDNLPVVEVCKACNESFSFDEQYLVAFLGAVLAGSVEASEQVHPAAARILAKNENLRSRIGRSCKTYRTISGETRHLWTPEHERVAHVILKNARGHAFYEFGEPMMTLPTTVWSAPLEAMTASERETFEDRQGGIASWPEVGSRMLQRVLTGQDLDGPWVVVQSDIYRYSVVQSGGMRVKSVIFEYLATEVFWEH